MNDNAADEYIDDQIMQGAPLYFPDLEGSNPELSKLEQELEQLIYRYDKSFLRTNEQSVNFDNRTRRMTINGLLNLVRSQERAAQIEATTVILDIIEDSDDRDEAWNEVTAYLKTLRAELKGESQ